jgi:Zn-dependent protease with chaperone function
MDVLLRFLASNLAASLLAGILAWLLVTAALHLLRARSAFLHASFLALPLLKSILVLAGMGPAFPWPGSWFRAIQHQALPPLEALPFVLAWLGLAAGGYTWVVWQARRRVLRQAVPPGDKELARLSAALGRVTRAYAETPCCQAGEILCCISDLIPTQPQLMVSAALRSPLALVEGGAPLILFPRGLLDRLDDDELAMALAHELNHFALRKPVWRSSGILRRLILVSPIAFLLADYYQREEEKACDDLAVAVFKQPEVYAGMLLKSYQYAHQMAAPAQPQPVLPGLLGGKAFFSRRVERLLAPAPAKASPTQLRALIYFTWVVLVYFIFLAQFGS